MTRLTPMRGWREWWTVSREVGAGNMFTWRVGIGHVVMYGALVVALSVGFILQGGLLSRESKDRRDAVVQNLRARADDCAASNDLRRGLLVIVNQSTGLNREANRLFKVPRRLVDQEERLISFERRVFAERNCRSYVNEARPKR